MSTEPEPDQEENEGTVDATSVLYILGGIPAMVLFFVLLFTLTRTCGLPA